MVIGSLGEEIIFQVSDEQVETLDNFKRKSKANFAEHKIIGNPAILEFLGRELEEITFTVTLSRDLGIDDLLMEAQKFRQKLWDGTAEFLSIGNHLYTQNKMVIIDLSEDVKYFDGRGRHILTELNITLKEYREVISG